MVPAQQEFVPVILTAYEPDGSRPKGKLSIIRIVLGILGLPFLCFVRPPFFLAVYFFVRVLPCAPASIDCNIRLQMNVFLGILCFLGGQYGDKELIQII